MKKLTFFILLTMTMLSCGKNAANLSVEEKQMQQEQNEPLKHNELLEEGGLRFRVITPMTDTAIIQIDLKIYKGSGATKSATPEAISKDGNMNYSILNDQLKDNCDYTLTIEYNKILQNGSYNLFTEGFTSINGNKEFLLTGFSFNTGSVGTTKDLMLIKKGILKFSLYAL